MERGKFITNCWGQSFTISPTTTTPLSHPGKKWGLPSDFHSLLHASTFVSTLSDYDVQSLCHRFCARGLGDTQDIQKALFNGQLKVFPEENLPSPSTHLSNSPDAPVYVKPVESRSLIVVRSDIKSTLRLIVEQEHQETKQLEASYQKRCDLSKASAHVSHFASGLYNSVESLLIWAKDINDVVSLNQRLLRIMMAANTARHVDENDRYQVFQNTLAASEKKEIVEALGFDPSLITSEKITKAYELASMIHEDQLTQLILKQFIKDYIDAQHSLEWSEFAGGATFEIILTAVLMVFTGGVGVVASMGAKARHLKHLKKLGTLFTELAEAIKKIPKERNYSLRKVKEKEDRAGRKKAASKPSGSEIKDANDGMVLEESVVPDKLTTAQRIDKLDLEGHAPIRHGGPNRVTDLQLERRAVRGIDPASGTPFDAFNKFPDGSPKPHKVGRNATAFTSDKELLQADDFARNSSLFQQNIAAAKANGDLFVDAVELPLEDVFGSSYHNSVRGVARLGSKNNPTGHVPIDFTDGTFKAIYRLDQSGNVKLHTLYPNPKP